MEFIVVEKTSIGDYVVGQFDNAADAGQFALLSKKARPLREYNVYERK